MALLIMRLKLFWTPHLCIVASLVANKNAEFCLFDYLIELIVGKKNKNEHETSSSLNLKRITLIAVIALMSYGGIQNIKMQYEIQGEYNDLNSENLMHWINENTKLNDALACKLNYS